MKRDALSCFVAATIDGVVLQKLEREIGFLQLAGADVRWVKRPEMHLTFRFVGDVMPEDIPALEEAILEGTQEMSACRPMVQNITAFPSPEKPKVVAVGVADEAGILLENFAALEHAFRAAGFRPEKKKASPHVTLGRVRGDRNLSALQERMADGAERRFGLTTLNRIVLYTSDQTHQGTIYSELRDFPLA
jgi:RNA 2',3'-cyclic 3'-phosphodiesterase